MNTDHVRSNIRFGPSTENPIILLLITGTLLAGAVLLSKVAAAAGMPMLWYLAFAMGLSGAILTARARWREKPEMTNVSSLLYSLGAGALMAAGSILGYMSIDRVGAGFISVAMTFPTLITYILSLALGMERGNSLRLCGVILGLAGGLWFAISKTAEVSTSDVPAVIGATVMPFVLAIGNIYRTRFWPVGGKPQRLAGEMLLAGAFVTTPLALWYDGVTSLQMILRQETFALIVMAAIACFTLQYVSFFSLQLVAGPVYLSQIGSVAAVVGSLFAITLFGEAVPSGLLPATLLIAGGVVLFHTSSRR